MMSVNIVAPGRLNEKFLVDAMGEYSKRLTSYCKFNVIEISEAKIQNEDSPSQVQLALKDEAKLISKHIKKGYNIAMCIEGGQMSSEDFAKCIGELALFGESQINFVIGSSHGLSDEIKKMCDMRMSISKMTMPHTLCRVVITEQIYRAFKINAKERYHK